jgi:hypothetical protein
MVVNGDRILVMVEIFFGLVSGVIGRTDEKTSARPPAY